MFPLPNLSFTGGAGGSAEGGTAGGGTNGPVGAIFGDFQVGEGNVASNPDSLTQPTTQSPSQSLATGSGTTLSDILPWLLVGGALLVGVYVLKH